VKKKDIPITVFDEDQTSLRPPGEPGSLMNLLIAAGTHKIVRPREGVVLVVPVDADNISEAFVVKRRRGDGA